MRITIKRILAIFLILVMLHSLGACGGSFSTSTVPFQNSTAPASTSGKVTMPTTQTVSKPIETVPTPTEPELVDDGVLQIFANGDSFYTPDISHSVTDEGRAVPYYNDLLLVFTDYDLSEAERNAIAASVSGQVMGVVSGGIHAFQILVEPAALSDLESLADALMDQPNVLYACCEYPVQIMGTGDDNPWAYTGEEPEADKGNEENPNGFDWWAEAIGAYTAWEYSELCQEVRVGIIDDGFLAEHEDLDGKITFITNDENNTAANHGTFVAGIIGAHNNTVGGRGIADASKLYCADLWPTEDPNAYHTMGEYLAVINYMAQCGVRVVNNSWGCHLPSEETYLESRYGEATEGHEGEYEKWLAQRVNHDLIPTAEYCIVMISQLISSGYQDMLHVHAAGNGTDNGRSGVDAKYNGFFSRVTEKVYNAMDSRVLDKLSAAGISYQAIDQHILVVGAATNLARAENGDYFMTGFSNYGETVDICAPGYGIFSCAASGTDAYLGYWGGTSFAAPMVSGCAAMLWSLNPNLTAPEVRALLLSSAQVQALDIQINKTLRYPMVNIGAAVTALMAQMDISE